MTARVMLAVTAAVALVMASASAQQPRDGGAATTGTATISGRVFIDAATKLPARRARVTLSHVARSIAGQTATTDDAGAFVFRGVPAGQFEVQAFKNGFLRASYGATRPNRAGTPIVIKGGETIADLALTIVRGGVITGTVRDPNGGVIAGVDVRVLRIGYQPLSGEPMLGAASQNSVGITDDRGEYRAYGLPPGGYLVLVNPRNLGNIAGSPGAEAIRRLSPEEVQRALQTARATTIAPGALATAAAPPSRGPNVTYAPVFHPGSTEISGAATITLGAAEERTGVDVIIPLVPTATIRGRITSADGTPPPAMSVSVVPAGPQAGLLAGAGITVRTAMSAADGSYAVGSVTPGTYFVKTSAGGSSGRGAPVNTPTVSAVAEVHVTGTDLDVPLVLQPGVPVNGRVVFDGAQPTAAELESLAFMLLPPGSGGRVIGGGAGRVGADGRFTFAGVVPDTYRFAYMWNAASARDKWTLKGATANGADAFELPLRVDQGTPVNWTVTFTDTPSTLTGTFQDRAGRAASDYFILVFSADRQQWTPGSRRTASTRPATDGAFTIKGLPPGEYLLGALTDLEAGEWNDPTLLEQLSATSIKVTIREGATTTQDVRIGGN